MELSYLINKTTNRKEFDVRTFESQGSAIHSLNRAFMIVSYFDSPYDIPLYLGGDKESTNVVICYSYNQIINRYMLFGMIHELSNQTITYEMLSESIANEDINDPIYRLIHLLEHDFYDYIVEQDDEDGIHSYVNNNDATPYIYSLSIDNVYVLYETLHAMLCYINSLGATAGSAHKETHRSFIERFINSERASIPDIDIDFQ